MTDELDSLFNECHPAFSNHESWVKCRELMYGELTCLGRHTVTGMLAASGNQFVDWSGAYRLFSKQRIELSKIMNVVQSNVLQETGCLPYVVAHMDDTVIKKTGKCIPGTAWRRDALGPPFYTNFIWGNASFKCQLPSRVMAKSANQGRSLLIFTIAPQLLSPGKQQKKNNGKCTRKRKK